MYILPLTKKKPREAHLWQFDPSVFEPLRKAGIFERYVRGRAKSLGKHTLYSLAFAYPLLLVIAGVMFGGIVFWASLAGSMVVVGLVIKGAGFSGNFDNWDIGYKKFLGLTAAFGIYAAFVYGLEYVKLWTIPIFAGALVTTLVLSVVKSSIVRPRMPQLLEGRLNMFSGIGIATILSSLTFSVLTRNPSMVLVHDSSVTLRVLDVEYLAIWSGALIGLAGVFLTLRPPRKTILGSAVWVSLLFLIVEIFPVIGWNPSTLSLPLSDSVIAGETGAFLSGLFLILWGLRESRISRARSG